VDGGDALGNMQVKNFHMSNMSYYVDLTVRGYQLKRRKYTHHAKIMAPIKTRIQMSLHEPLLILNYAKMVPSIYNRNMQNHLQYLYPGIYFQPIKLREVWLMY
jgi:hypothetical protein